LNKIYVLFFTILYISHSFEIDINGGYFDSKEYSAIHLTSESKIECKTIRNDYLKVIKYLCKLDNKIPKSFSSYKNDFFEISQIKIKSQYFIEIKPLKLSYIKPIEYDLKDLQTVYQNNSKISNSWLLIGYEKDLIITSKKHKIGINFSVEVNKFNRPSLGAIDFDKKPMSFKDKEDIMVTLRAKALLKEKNYIGVVSFVDFIFQKMPDIIFRKELELQRIRALHKLSNIQTSRRLVKLGKQFLTNYPSNEATAEVLYSIADGYIVLDKLSKAKKILLEIAREEQSTGYFSKSLIRLGYIESLDKKNSASAKKLYVKALEYAKNKDDASEASYSLFVYYLSLRKLDKADKYYQKILYANPMFFIKNSSSSYKASRSLASHKKYDISIELLEFVLNNDSSIELNPQYEEMLRDISIWNSKVNNFKKAIFYAKKFLDEFPRSTYKNSVEKELKLYMFEYENEDINSTIKKFDKMLSASKNTKYLELILYKKIKLLFKAKMYDDIIRFQDRLEALPIEVAKDKQNILNVSRREHSKKLLNDKDCVNAIPYIQKYEIKFDRDVDETLYYCYMEILQYDNAKKVVVANFNLKELSKKIRWIDRAKELAKISNDSKQILLLSNDILELANSLKIDEYNYVLYDKFFASLELSKISTALLTFENIIKLFPVDQRNVRVLKKITMLYTDDKDIDNFIKYAIQLTKLQKSINVYEETPWIEFMLIDKYLIKKEFKKALALALELNNHKLSSQNEAKLLYMKSEIYRNMKNITKQKYLLEECANKKIDSKWKTLCKKMLLTVK
jgi:hypothetical protein